VDRAHPLVPALLAGAAVAAVVLWQIAPTLVGVFYDDGLYLGLAKALAEGQGYRHLHLPGAPEAAHYPIGYPAFLALLWKLWPDFPHNVVLFKTANALLCGVFVTLTVLHVAPRLRTPAWLTALAAGAGATAVPFVAVATVLFAEPLFLVLVAGACLLADRAATAEGRGALWQAALAGLVAGLAALTRSVGVAVLGGIVVMFLAAKRREAAALAAGVGLVMVMPWFIWARVHADGLDPLLASNYGTYGQFLAQGGAGWFSLGSIADLGRPLGALVLLPWPALVRWLVALAGLTLLLLGLLRLGRRAPALGWTIAVYSVIIALWPYGPERFVWAALPWLFVAFVVGMHRVLAWAAVDSPRPVNGSPLVADVPSPRLVVRALAVTIALALALGFGVGQGIGYDVGGATATQRGISAAFDDVLPWIASTPESAVIGVEDEALVWLYTGRRAVPTYLWRVRGRDGESFGPDSLRAFMRRNGVTHVVLTGPGSEAAPDLDALAAPGGNLSLVAVLPHRRLAFVVAPSP